MKFSGKVGNRPLNKWLNFGGNPDHGPDMDPDCDTGKTALAEVCTVPVLLVSLCNCFSHVQLCWLLVHTFIHCQLNYCNALLIRIADAEMKQLWSLQNAAAYLVLGESTLWPCCVSSAQPPLPASSAASYFQGHCPCVEVCQQCCSDISQELCIPMESVCTPRSSTVVVCINWRHPATKSTDINWQAELCFQWTCSVEQLATSCVWWVCQGTLSNRNWKRICLATTNIIWCCCDVSFILMPQFARLTFVRPKLFFCHFHDFSNVQPVWFLHCCTAFDLIGSSLSTPCPNHLVRS